MTTASHDSVHVRWLIRRDTPRVLEIEESCFKNGWSEDELLEFLRGRSNIGMVATIEERVVGYVCYELRAKSFRIHNIAVDKDNQRTGIGTAMIEKVRGKMRTDARDSISLMVRENNFEAIRFFQAMGLVITKRVDRPYGDMDEDAYEMRYEIGGRKLCLRNRVKG